MTAKPIQHPWSSEALFNKALVYIGEMERHTANDWQFGFWSSLSLELIARAAVAHISPTLLADRKAWRNVYYALGNATTAKRFIPTSITTNEVLQILKEILPDFTEELFDFCVKRCAERNAELHSGEEVFLGLGTSEWLAKYYKCCSVLLPSMGRTLHELFNDVGTAKSLIASLDDTAEKAVQQDIQVHKKAWIAKDPKDQEIAVAQASAWAARHVGHRVKCPACESPALLRGSSQGAVATEVGDDVIVQRQTMLPSAFECVGCGLKIAGLSKLSACGLGDAFTSTSTYSPAEFFGLHTADELDEARGAEPEWEPDFNEY